MNLYAHSEIFWASNICTIVKNWSTMCSSIPLPGQCLWHLYFVWKNVARWTYLPGRASGRLQMPDPWDKIKSYYISIFKKYPFMFSIKFCSLLWHGQNHFISNSLSFLFYFLVISRSANQKAGDDSRHSSLKPEMKTWTYFRIIFLVRELAE